MNSRAMRWWDIDDVMDAERELFAATAWTPAQFWSELSQANRSYRVVEDGGGLVAYAGLLVNPPTADVQTIAVVPRAQRRSIGRTLLAELIDTARAAGCTEMLLEVRADNDAAICLYRGEGFETIARRAAYYGPGSDALIMRRRPL